MAWLERAGAQVTADGERHRAHVRRLRQDLDGAGCRATLPPPEEAGNWVAVIDTSNDERGCPVNTVTWLPRALYDAYQDAMCAHPAPQASQLDEAGETAS